MNNNRKSVRRWHKALKPVHPAVIALQAAGVMAALFSLSVIIQYGNAAPPVRISTTQRTGCISSGELLQMVNQLDPTIRSANNENLLAQSMHKMHLRQLRHPMPRPAEIYDLRRFTPAGKLPVREFSPTADLRIGKNSTATTPAAGDHAVMYSENGEELARWKSSFYANEKYAFTMVRITGSGIMKRTAIVQSCGDRNVDLMAAAKALDVKGASGIYSIFYPYKAQEK